MRHRLITTALLMTFASSPISAQETLTERDVTEALRQAQNPPEQLHNNPITGTVAVADPDRRRIVVNDQTLRVAKTVKLNGVILPAETAIREVSDAGSVKLTLERHGSGDSVAVTKMESNK